MRHRSTILKLLSAVIVFGTWEIAGRIPVSYAFPTFLDSMVALVSLAHSRPFFDALSWRHDIA